MDCWMSPEGIANANSIYVKADIAVSVKEWINVWRSYFDKLAYASSF